METKKIELLKKDEPKISEILINIKEKLKHKYENDKLSGKEVKKYFEDVIDTINSGGFSGVGSFNFYPSTNSIGCCELCFAIATNKFGHEYKKDKSRTGFKGLIKELIKYWLGCNAINKETVILALDWDDEVFNKEWKEIVDHYRIQLNKTVKIYEIIESSNSYIERYPG